MSTWVHQYFSLPQWSMPLGQQGHMVSSVGGSFAYFARNARCTVTIDLPMWYYNTQNDFSPERPFSRYIHLHRLAAEMWTMMKNNLLGKKNLSCSFYLYRFRKYVPCGFPVINFCNPRVHYQTLCISCNWPTCFPSVMHYTSMQGFSAPHHYFLVWLGASTISNCTVFTDWEMLSERLSLPGLGCRFLASIGELGLYHRKIYSVCVCVHTHAHLWCLCICRDNFYDPTQR
jgi:hypothetical protein